MVRVNMLQAFRGTIDEYGISTLRPEKEEELESQQDKAGVEFWAVLHRAQIPQICDAFASGDRELATRLVLEEAMSIGSIIPSRH